MKGGEIAEQLTRNEFQEATLQRMRASGEALKWLLETYEPPFRRWHYKEAAEKFGGAASAIEKLNAIRKRNPELVERVLTGEIQLFHASKEAGFSDTMFRKQPTPSVTFGKGDKFWQAASPLTRYLKAWKSRGYQFTHLPPKEAQKRLLALDSLIEELSVAREDLVMRSQHQALSVHRQRKDR